MRRNSALQWSVGAVDAAVLLAASWIAWRLWLWWRPHLDLIVQVRWIDLLGANEWMPPGGLLVAAWLLFLRQFGFYDPDKMTTVVRELGALSRSLIYVLILVVTIQFFLPQRFYARSLIVAFLTCGFGALAAWRWALLRLQTRMPQPLAALENVAIFGVGEEARMIAERLEREQRYHTVGFFEPVGEEPVVDGALILGGVDRLGEQVNDHDIQTVLLATRQLRREEALEIATRCGQMDLRVLQVPFTWGVAHPRLSFAEVGALQLIDLSDLSYPTLVEVFKRAFDIAAVLCLFLFIWPIFLITAIAVRLDSPGDVFYAGPRVGRGGRTFPFMKFRSMIPGADQLKDQLREQNESDGLLFKIKDDPRITRVGRFIRKYSIDELPQFWNVLRGDMNLVGPRPLPVKDLQDIGDDPEIAYWFELRHKVPPGITGLWQVSGRSNLGFSEMIDLDIHYIQNWSFWLDIKILLLTIPAVLKGRGAA